MIGDPEETALNEIVPVNVGRGLPDRRETRFTFSLRTIAGESQLRASEPAALQWLLDQAKHRKPRVRESDDWARDSEFVLISSAPRSEIEGFWESIFWEAHYKVLASCR